MTPSDCFSMMLCRLLLPSLLTFVTLGTADILDYDGFVPEVEELVESNIAPLLTYDGLFLHASSRGRDGAKVCGGTSSITPRMVFPVTLKKLDSMHKQLQQGTSDSEAVLQLDMVEGCYMKRDGDSGICEVALLSEPAHCGMNIEDSTMYWSHRLRERTSVLGATKVFENAASVLVEDIMYVRQRREELRRTIRLNKEFNKAGVELFEIAKRGWKANVRNSDKKAFRRAVSVRGTQIVREAYVAAMRKWSIVKQWFVTSIGKVDRPVPTFRAEGNGTLLSMEVMCNVTEHLNDWLPITDRNYYIANVHSRSYSELKTFFRGKRVGEGDQDPYPNIEQLPCAAVSLAVAMMLHDDFPARLLHQNITGETSTDALWPWQRFEELNKVIKMTPKYRSYTMKQFASILNYTIDHHKETGRFGGGRVLAECVTRTILRITGKDGSPPQPSLFDCYSLSYNESRLLPSQVLNASVSDNSVAGGRGMESDVGPPCPWGFTRAGGNSWDARDPCVMCPPGSFGDGENGCLCSGNSYPSATGCLPKEEGYPVTPKWTWLAGQLDARAISGSNGESVPLLMVEAPPSVTKGDKVRVLIKCTKGLTEFKATMASAGGDSPGAQPFRLPLGAITSFFTTSATTISLGASAAFGGDQCNFSVKVSNPKYVGSLAVRVGSLMVLPCVAELTSTSPLRHRASVDLVSLNQLPSCSNETPDGYNGIGVGLCTANGSDVSVRVSTRAYTPLTDGAWHILKRIVWTNGTKAEELGEAVRPVVERLRVRVNVAYKRHTDDMAVTHAFEGNIALGRETRITNVKASNISELMVTTQIIDVCATSQASQHVSCSSATQLFVPSRVYNISFIFAPRNTTSEGNATGMWRGATEGDTRRRHDEASNKTREVRLASGMAQLSGPLIAVGAIDALLLLANVALAAIYYTRIRSGVPQGVGVHL